MSEKDDLPISRWSDPRALVVGARVVVRRRLTELSPHGNHFTDVIGVVESFNPLVVTDSEGKAHTIEHSMVEVIKPLAHIRVRNSDIRSVEYATALAFPGIHHHWVDGWLVRISDGVTERSNSAIPLEPHTAFSPIPIDEIRSLFRSHHLPTMLAVPDRIARQAFDLDGQWDRGPEIIVMTKNLTTDSREDSREDAQSAVQPESSNPLQALAAGDPSLQGLRVHITDQPDPDWLKMYHFRGKPLPESSLRQLCAEIDGTMGFGKLVVGSGASGEQSGGEEGTEQTVAITRGTVTQSPDGRKWLGYSAVEVAPDFRRKGLATALGKEMMAWGASLGAEHAYLQVIESNTAGRALYHSLGFGEHHRHRYLTERGEG